MSTRLCAWLFQAPIRFASLAVLGLLLSLAPPAQAAPFAVKTFSPWAGYAIPNGQWLTGDVNGDGRTDVIHPVQGADYVNTWLSNGDGTFNVRSFRPWAGYGIPNGIWLTGDFNGDGKTDIFHAVQGTDYAHVWTSRGDGTYTVTTFRPWAGYGIPNGIWLAADVNGDGKTDIIHAVQGADYVNVWLSNGDGTFRVTSFRPWAGYGIPNGIWMTGDFNGDGKADILHAVQGTDYVNVWLSNGDGSFRVSSFRPWAGYGIPNGEWFVADLNGDGKSDIVHAVQGADYVNTWMSNGNGTFNVRSFRPWAGYGIPNGVWRVGDFNGDGKADIIHAVANTSYANVWLGDGTGQFKVISYSPWAGYAIPNGLWLTGDFNGDRKTDVLHAVQNTSYVNTWLSTLPRPGEASIDGLEVSQAIQEMGHSVPLVADKPTVARVYLNLNGPAATLTGTLQGRRGGGAWVNLAPLNNDTVNPAENFALRTKREDITKSLNFRLPAGWDDVGLLQVRVASLSRVGGGAVACSDCATTMASVVFQPVAPMRLRVLGLRYSSGTPAVSHAPRALDFTLINSWLRRAYPISTLNMSSATINASNAWPFDCNAANAQVATVRANDVAAGTDHRTHYFGLVDDGGGFMRGCAAGIPGSPAPETVAAGPTGSNNWGWDNDNSYGDWYTGHELGHTFGRLHPGSGCGDSADDNNEPFTGGQISGNDGAYVGLDVGDATNGLPMAALPGVPWHDVMTYCQRQWLSYYTYGGILARLNGEGALPAGPTPAGLMAPAGGLVTPPNLIVAAKMPAKVLAAPRTTAAQAHASTPAAAAPATVVNGATAAPEVTVGSATAPALPEPDQPGPASVRHELLAPAAPAPALAAVGPVKAPAEGKVQQGDLVSVVATVNFTRNTVKLESVSRVGRGLAALVPGDGAASLRFVGANGQTLSRQPIGLRRNSDIPANEDQTGLIDAVVPVAKGAVRMEVLIGDTVMATREIARSAPKLSLPASQAFGLGAGPRLVSWQASHAEAKPLSYTVLTSADGGKSWQTLAVGLKENSIAIDPQDFGEAKSVLVRVIANDGFNTTTVTLAQPVSLR